MTKSLELWWCRDELYCPLEMASSATICGNGEANWRCNKVRPATGDIILTEYVIRVTIPDDM